MTVLGSGLLSISLCGGLVFIYIMLTPYFVETNKECSAFKVLMFSAFLLYDTQKIVHDAERHSEDFDHPYDPINA